MNKYLSWARFHTEKLRVNDMVEWKFFALSEDIWLSPCSLLMFLVVKPFHLLLYLVQIYHRKDHWDKIVLILPGRYTCSCFSHAFCCYDLHVSKV